MSFVMGLLPSRRSSRRTNENLSVQLYNKHLEGERYKFEEGVTCEDLCQAIGEKLGITPTMLHCFGLKKCYKTSHVWLSPHHRMSIQTEQVDIHFRMRFIPTSWAQDDDTLSEDWNCVRYLFWQLYWDFLHDDIEYYSNKDNAEKARGLVVLNVLIQMRIDTELRQSNGQYNVPENLQTFLADKKFKHYLPETLKKTFIDGIVLVSNMEKKVLEYQQRCPAEDHSYNSLALMQTLIRNVLQKDKNLFCELHLASTIHFNTIAVRGNPKELERIYKEKEELSIIVDFGRSPAEMFINRGKHKRGILIHNLDAIEKRTDSVKMDNDKEVDFIKVQLSRVDGPPEVFYFEEMSKAESFVTCLESYYRLTENFYQSLCRPLQPRKIQDMNEVKAHGPITDECLKAKIDKQYGKNSDVYTLRKSLLEHDVFEVVRPVRERLRVVPLGKLTYSEGMYHFDNEPPTKDLKKLMNHRVMQVEGLSATNCRKISPKFEACDVLRQLFEVHDSDKIETEDEEEELRRIERENQPKVIMGSSIEVLSCIGKGYFTEVYQGTLKGEENVIIKRLREKEILERMGRLGGNHAKWFSKLKKAFNDSFNKLMELNDPKYFLGFTGVALMDPQAMVLKGEKYGNLTYFLTTRSRYECQLTMHHLQTISIQLADALGYMEEKNCFHGNLHCGNIIVTKYLRNEMLVKITDPGMVEFYNQLRLDTVCNRNRLPWIAPELYENLSAVTIRSEVYAYGMTLWQIFNEGQTPLNLPKLMTLSAQELCEKFTEEKFPLPCPVYLMESSDDPKEVKTIKKNMLDTILNCCVVNEEDRLCPMEIIRKLRGNMQSYGQYYHDYNIIYESSQNFSIQSSGQTSPGSNDTGFVNNSQLPVPIDDMRKPRNTDQELENKVIKNSDMKFRKFSFTFEQIDFKWDKDENTSPKVLRTSTVQDENTHQKSLMNAQPNDGNTSHGQSFVCLIEPGSMMSEAERSVATFPDHPTPTDTRRPVVMEMEPIVSDVKFIIAEGRLSIDTKTSLGSGHYGNIFKGKLEPNSSSGFNKTIDVAVKALKDDQADRFASEFKKEARIMEKLQHDNIVKFYGIYRGGKYMVMELVNNGSLLQFVIGHRKRGHSISEPAKLQIGIDITAGMEYLQSQHIIHCDLAARNVLLTFDFRAKVSDFGLSKILCQDKDYYRRTDNKTIPILWCAPEWIGFKRFLLESDVWSFGVVLWEIYSYGRMPMIGQDKDLNRFYMNLYEGKRLHKPKGCAPEMYDVMNSCWTWNPEERHSFSQLKHGLQAMLDGLQASKHSKVEDESSSKIVSDTSTTTTSSTSPKNQSQSQQQSNHGTSPRSNEGQTERSSDNTGQRSKRHSEPGTDETSSATLYGKVNNEANSVPEIKVEARSTTNEPSKVKVKRAGDISMDNTKTEPPRAVGQSVVIMAEHGSTADSALTFMKSPRSNNNNLFIEGLIVDRNNPIGQGNFGKVYRGTYQETEVAVKSCYNEEYRARFKREYELLLDIQHPNIVKLFGIHVHSVNGNSSGIEYVMEYFSKGSLDQLLIQSSARNNPIHERLKIQYLIHIAQGMDYLFSKCIVHGDLKADNVLVNHDNIAKISDFGLAKKLEGDEINNSYKRKEGMLKIRICAPECLESKFTRYSDNWSYGLLCLEVLDDGKQPNFSEPVDFSEASNCNELFTKLQNGETYRKPSGCPQQLFDTISQCWRRIPKERMPYKILIQEFRSYLGQYMPST